VTDTPKITIIGAGLIGLCTADALALRGVNVTVVDAKPGPCQGTSFANSGMIHPSQALSWDMSGVPTKAELETARATAALGARSKTRLESKLEELRFPARPPGCIQIHPDIERAQAAIELQRSLNVRAEICVDRKQSFDQTACIFPDDSSADARAFGCALAEDLSARGVQFIYGAGDVDFDVRKMGYSLTAARRAWAADPIVIAAGVHSTELLARLDIVMTLNPVLGVSADFQCPVDFDDLPPCPIMDVQSRSALTVFEDRIRISGGWNVGTLDPLFARWREIAPGLVNRLGEPLSTWVGVRPVSPLGRPYISATKLPGLWVNTGHGHMGWTLCAGSGDLLSEMILDGRLAPQFSFNEFAS